MSDHLFGSAIVGVGLPQILNAAPAATDLTSIIIPCHNQLDYTRACLTSILHRTRSPYELIVVNNGSTDGTPAFLEQLRQQPGPTRVEVVRNEVNVGFPVGCNQGIARAQGRYLVFLNNDTIVTEGWLDGLSAWAKHDWPSVGLVGAVSNYATNTQQVPFPYTDLRNLDAFAAQRQREYAGKALEVKRLSGFCLLARREVIDRIGGFDERFGLGFFDDDDLCFRAQDAGFRLLVALNVYVHHFGVRTFSALGINCEEQLKRNFELFRAKWGPERTAGYHMPGERGGVQVLERENASMGNGAPVAEPQVSVLAPDVSRHSTRTMRVSLCMIVKNEEANLPACLESVSDLVDEIVIADTGSTDATKDVAARFGAKVHDFPWVESFAAARNESLRHATGEWVFWLDADDRLDEPNRQKLNALFAGLKNENAAYVMDCLCLPDQQTQTATVVQHVRLFRNYSHLRWQYRVHEQILPALRKLNGQVRFSDVVIHHVGYQEPALRKQKLERDLRLLSLDHAEQPDEPFILFNLGSVYLELGRIAEALPMLRKSLERSHPSDSIVRKLYALIAQGHEHLGQANEALAACRAGRAYYPDDAELLFREGLLLHRLGDLDGAEH